MAAAPLMIAHDIYRRSRYRGKHPLAITRVAPVVDLARALGWLDEARYHEAPIATDDQLARFHDRGYIAALRAAEERQSVLEAHKARYGLGVNGNGVFGEVFRRPAIACGATLMAAAMLRDGGTVHSPAGGTHHGRRDRAAGFCFLNDPVLGILAFLDQGLDRIAYVDIDAHHGDGVEDAFANDPRVLTLSVHEAGRWPRTGTDSTAAMHRYNVPVPAGFHDGELAYLVETVILPLLDGFGPQALIVQCGADALADDPMSGLALSNRAYRRTLAALMGAAPRLLVLGGGGYNPWAAARCWTGLWAVLDGRELPDRLPEEAQTVLRALDWQHSRGRNPPERWFTALDDPPSDGPVRGAVREAAAACLRG